jgi:hypothetical protein
MDDLWEISPKASGNIETVGVKASKQNYECRCRGEQPKRVTSQTSGPNRQTSSRPQLHLRDCRDRSAIPALLREDLEAGADPTAAAMVRRCLDP